MNLYPYTNFHEINLDWIIEHIKKLHNEWDDFKVINTIHFEGNWNVTKQYPAWALVNDENIGYISVKPVPKGVDIHNLDYWKPTADYSELVADITERVVVIENQITVYDEQIDALGEDINELNTDVENNSIAINQLAERIDDCKSIVHDNEALVTPAVLGKVTIPNGSYAQGMTSDGALLYMATVSTNDGVSSPRIIRINPNNLTIIMKAPPQSGHYNNLNYHNGKIYCTGFTGVAEDYSQIYKYDFNTNSGVLKTLTNGEHYWNFAIGDGAYGNCKFYVGSIAERNAFNLYSENVASSGKFFPFTKCKTPYFNGVWQGCCLVERDNCKFIATVLCDRDSFQPGTTDSQNEIIVTTLTGDVVKRIVLDLGSNSNLELEDCCMIGTTLYINASDGTIFKIDDFVKLFCGFVEETVPTLYDYSRFLYINENGTETWYNTTSGQANRRLLKSFRLSPLTTRDMLDCARAEIVIDNRHFPISITPVNNVIWVEAKWTRGNYLNEVRFNYDKTTDGDFYKYTLNESSIMACYRNQSGAVTRCDNITDMLHNFFYDSDVYIYCIVSEPSAKYTYTPDEF